MTTLQKQAPPSLIYIPDGAAQERDKYAEIWEFEDYRKHSPGQENVQRFLDVLKPKPGSTVVDIGCGQGNAGLALDAAGLAASWMDITDAALDPSIDRTRFIQAAMWDQWAFRRWDFGFCVDVLEHIPPEYTMLCIARIVAACRTSWLQIANLPDTFGEKIGQPLHLTVRPFSWWLVRLATVGKVIDARDLCGRSLFVMAAK